MDFESCSLIAKTGFVEMSRGDYAVLKYGNFSALSEDFEYDDSGFMVIFNHGLDSEYVSWFNSEQFNALFKPNKKAP